MDVLSVGQKFGNLLFQLLAGATQHEQPSPIAPQFLACNTFTHIASEKLRHHKKIKRLHSRQGSPQAVHIIPEVPLLLSDSQFADGETQVHQIYSWDANSPASDPEMKNVIRSITRKFGPRRNAQGYNYAAQLCFMKDEAFVRHVGISRRTFEDLMVRISEATQDTIAPRRGHETCLRIRLLMTIIYLTSKKVYRDLHELFGYCEANICRLLCRTINEINMMSSNAIKWPSDLESTAAEFYEVDEIPGVVGAIDAVHLVARAPEKMHDEYRNARGKHTIILLAICDARKRFTYVSVGYPGTFTHHKCLESTDLGVNLDHIPNNYFPMKKFHLVGNENFHLRHGLMVPYKHHEITQSNQLDFNKKLLKTQSIAASTFVEMKSRFQTLTKLEMSIERVVEFTTACCILHNVCLDNGDAWTGPYILDDESMSPNEPCVEAALPCASAVAKRDAIREQIYAGLGPASIQMWVLLPAAVCYRHLYKFLVTMFQTNTFLRRQWK